jgi:hypothetical protein
MRLNERDVALILSDEGRDVMRLSAVNLPEAGAVAVRIQDTDDVGLWVRTQREDGEHVLLIRWEYVLSVDFPTGEVRRNVGLNL